MATAYPGGLRKRGGLLDYEDTIKPTPRNPFLGGVADLLGQAYKLPEMPRLGVPGLDFVAANRNRLLDMLNIGDVQKTAEAMAYGNRIGTGAGMTYQPLPETMGAAMAVAPFAGKAIRATEGLPVGASTKLIDDAAIFKDASVLINPKNLKPLNKVEDVEKYKTIVKSMEESGYQGRPILAYMDKGKAKALTGSHRIFAARKAGIDVPVVFVNPSVMKWEDKSGLFGTFKESIKDQRVYNYLKAAGDDVAASLSKLEDQVVQPSMSPYPQAEAMRLAQQRAALPVEQGGLGLLESNTAMDRAKAMGFDTDAYHATNAKNITKFDLGKSNRGEGISVALTPENAQAYGNITYPLKVNQQKIFDPTNKEQLDKLKNHVKNLMSQQNSYDKNSLSFYPYTSDKILNNLANPQTGAYYLENEIVSKSLKDLGYSGSVGMESGQSQLKMFNPQDIRSRFAAFDPFRRTAATAAAMGVAAPDLLAAETPEELKRRQLRGLLAP